jgi:hypothetical protein
VKSNIDTSRAADINFSCLLCLRRQRLQKIDISNTVAFSGYFDYIQKYSMQIQIKKQVIPIA